MHSSQTNNPKKLFAHTYTQTHQKTYKTKKKKYETKKTKTKKKKLKQQQKKIACKSALLFMHSLL